MVASKYLSTSKIARICQVTPVTVGNWIRAGKLKASRVPGGNYRVTAENLASFLRDADMPVSSGLISSSARVLIVADHPQAARRISDILAQDPEQWQIDTAIDCFGAGVKIAQIEPDLLVLIWPVSGIDREACQRMRQTEVAQKMRVLVIDAPVCPDEPAKAMRIEADAHLPENFSAQKLRAVVSQLLSQGNSLAMASART